MQHNQTQITNIHKEIRDDLSNIVDNLGITKAKFLREVVSDLLKKTPYDQKTLQFQEDKTKITIYDLDDETIETLDAIAKNKGYGTVVKFLRVHLYEVVKNYPEKYKRKHPDF